MDSASNPCSACTHRPVSELRATSLVQKLVHRYENFFLNDLGKRCGSPHWTRCELLWPNGRSARTTPIGFRSMVSAQKRACLSRLGAQPRSVSNRGKKRASSSRESGEGRKTLRRYSFCDSAGPGANLLGDLKVPCSPASLIGPFGLRSRLVDINSCHLFIHSGTYAVSYDNDLENVYSKRQRRATGGIQSNGQP